MSKPILTYFNMQGGRGLPVRLALEIKGIQYVDNRINGADWPKHKAGTPYGGLPLFEDNGKVLAQSNAILAYVAEKYNFGPTDPWKKGKVIEALEAIEEISSKVFPIVKLTGTEEEKAPQIAAFLADGSPFRHLLNGLINIKKTEGGASPFLVGELSVADLKVYTMIRRWNDNDYAWLPRPFITENAASLVEIFDAVHALPQVEAYWKLPTSLP